MIVDLRLGNWREKVSISQKNCFKGIHDHWGILIISLLIYLGSIMLEDKQSAFFKRSSPHCSIWLSSRSWYFRWRSGTFTRQSFVWIKLFALNSVVNFLTLENRNYPNCAWIFWDFIAGRSHFQIWSSESLFPRAQSRGTPRLWATALEAVAISPKATLSGFS